MQNKFKIILMFSLGIFLYSCEYEELEAPSNLPQNVSFKNDLIPILNQSCNVAGCHNVGGTSPDLSEANAYNTIINDDLLNLNTPEKSKLYKRMTDVQNPMPMSGILPQTQTDKFYVWIKEGAQNN